MDDLEFIRKCARGDKQAWDEFVDKYSRLVYKYINNILQNEGLNQFSQDTINDIFQDLIFSLVKDNFKKLMSFKAKNGCSFATWLRQVAINFTIDYIRKFKPTVSLDAETEEDFTLKDILADDSLPVSNLLEDEEKMTQLKDCIGKLDIDDKYFLELHINRGFSLEELSDVFRLSRGAIDMRKSRIIKRLRDCFQRKGFFANDEE